MSTIIPGMTGTDFMAALNKEIDTKKVYNALRYGIVTGSSDQSVAIQALIEAVHLVGGTIYFPAGVYTTRTITTYGNVLLKGDKATQLTSHTPNEPLIRLINTVQQGCYGGFEDLILHGNGKGSIGLDLQWVGVFHFKNIQCFSFLTYSVKLIGCLVGQFSDCVFGTTAGTGIFADRYAAQSIACNDVLFKNCQFYQSQQWAVDWQYGASVMFENCSFEINGTVSDSDTGCVRFTRGELSTGVTWHGILMKNCWLEANRGSIIKIDGYAAQEQIHVIESTIFSNNNAAGSMTIRVNGDNYIRLLLKTCSISDTNAIDIVGVNGYVINEMSAIAGAITGENYQNLIDMEGLLKLTPQALPPSDASEGKIYADTDHHLYYHNGTTWVQLDN